MKYGVCPAVLFPLDLPAIAGGAPLSPLLQSRPLLVGDPPVPNLQTLRADLPSSASPTRSRGFHWQPESGCSHRAHGTAPVICDLRAENGVAHGRSTQFQKDFMMFKNLKWTLGLCLFLSATALNLQAQATGPTVDWDGDGIPNASDLDHDNDGIFDHHESIGGAAAPESQPIVTTSIANVVGTTIIGPTSVSDISAGDTFFTQNPMREAFASGPFDSLDRGSDNDTTMLTPSFAVNIGLLSTPILPKD